MEELLLALLGEFVETCDHIGWSWYEDRANKWLALCGVTDLSQLPETPFEIEQGTRNRYLMIGR